MSKKNRKHKRKIVITSWFGLFSLIVGVSAYVAYHYLFEKKNQSLNNNINNNENNNPTTNGFDYVRPPLGAKFHLDTNQEESIVLISSHFDSPGNSSEEKPSSIANGQGEQEVSEAYNVDKVLDWFKDYFATQNLIFAADTNIKEGNQNTTFNIESLKSKNYNFLFEDNKIHSSSLSNSFGKYANPYDKIIYLLNNFEIINDYSDINGALKPNIKNGFIIDTFKATSSIDNPNNVGWVDDESHLWAKEGQTSQEKLFNYTKYGISDHVPVGMDIKLINSQEKIRIGFWNVLNFSFTDKEITNTITKPSDNLTAYQISEAKKQSHARNIAKIVDKCNFDLISFVEINNNTNPTNFQYFIKYLNSLNSNNNYSGFLSIPTESTSASPGQVEQVAFIYNDNKLNLEEKIFPKFYNNEKNAILKIVYSTSVYSLFNEGLLQQLTKNEY